MTKLEYVRSLPDKKIVLGNGFDCYCGLKTRYSDYFATKKTEYDTLLSAFGDEGIYNSILTDSLSDNRITDTERKTIKNNTVWDLFFALRIAERNCNWCDIEAEMLVFLSETGDGMNAINVLNVLEKPGVIFVGMSKWNYSLAAFLKWKHKEIGRADFTDILLKELNEYENSFGEYIRQEYEGQHVHFNRNAFRFESSVSKDFTEIVSVDTFNYTPCYRLDEFGAVNHINGDVEAPIFGIDSYVVAPNNDFFRFTKTARRMGSSMKSYRQNESPLEKPFHTLVVFGHSLNQQDYSYFFPIFDYLKLTDPTNTTKLVFAYSIYDLNRRDEIITTNMMNVANLITNYDHYTGRKESRLLDNLSANGRIIMYEIES